MAQIGLFKPCANRAAPHKSLICFRFALMEQFLLLFLLSMFWVIGGKLSCSCCCLKLTIQSRLALQPRSSCLSLLRSGIVHQHTWIPFPLCVYTCEHSTCVYVCIHVHVCVYMVAREQPQKLCVCGICAYACGRKTACTRRAGQDIGCLLFHSEPYTFVGRAFSEPEASVFV